MSNIQEIFGSMVFNETVMKSKLPHDTYKALKRTIARGKALPAYGVYACWLEAKGAIYPAVVNVGRHPTLPEGPVTVEAHALDASLSIYGEFVRLIFLRFQRPEQTFEGVDALRAQIARDTEACRAYFASLK